MAAILILIVRNITPAWAYEKEFLSKEQSARDDQSLRLLGKTIILYELYNEHAATLKFKSDSFSTYCSENM